MSSHPPAVRLILASASPARLATLRGAGLAPDVVVSGVDETGVEAATVPALVEELSRRKARAVADRQAAAGRPTVVLGCDSLLELDGRPYGKPADAGEATDRWRRMRGGTGTLHTGHTVIRLDQPAQLSAVASTTVHFADLSDAEITAYVATGEPLEVAGAFTVDGRGGPFVTGVEGDHHAVVGVSLPLLRRLLTEVGLSLVDLWT